MCQSPVYAGGWASIKFFVNWGVEEGQFVFARLLMLLQVIKCVLHFPSFFFFLFPKKFSVQLPHFKSKPLLQASLTSPNSLSILSYLLWRTQSIATQINRGIILSLQLWGLCDHAFVSLDLKSLVIIIFESTVLSLFKAFAKTNRTISDFELQCSRLS